jgi:glycerophosphoryl diester phosphodiesterase
MVEIDVRLTKDSVLITQHDPHFKRYFNVDRQVSDMTWNEISELETKDGHKVQLLEDVLAHCEGKIQVMLDNKIRGFNEPLFSKLVETLKKHNLDKEALMIGTEASTPFFTGKIKLSCTRKQLEENMKKPGYKSSHYYLFSKDISKEDYIWATSNGIQVVGVVNSFTFDKNKLMEEAEMSVDKLKEAGIRYFQIDTVFERFLVE